MNKAEKKPVLVKLFCGLLLAKESHLDAVLEKLKEYYGEIDLVVGPFSFDEFSNYYEQEMGVELRRYFISFKKLVDRIDLPEIKNASITIEKTFSDDNNKRKINIDPGYLTLGQVFLASTKDNFCRIYIRDGIYAEVTLRFVKDTYTAFPYTYKDYRSEKYLAFFNEVRKIYKDQGRGLIVPACLQKEVGEKTF